MTPDMQAIAHHVAKRLRDKLAQPAAPKPVAQNPGRVVGTFRQWGFTKD